MPYQSGFFERLYVLRWFKPISTTDVDKVLKEVQAARDKVGAPVLSLVMVPGDLPPPDEALRKQMGDKIPPLLTCLESIHYVVEGDGFKNSILRSALTSVVLLSGKRGKITIYKTADEAFTALEPRLKEHGLLLPQVRMAVFRAGLLRVSADPPAQRHAGA